MNRVRGGESALNMRKGSLQTGVQCWCEPCPFRHKSLVYPKLPYDPDNDFTPLPNQALSICPLRSSQFSLKDVKSLIEWIKKIRTRPTMVPRLRVAFPHFFGLMIGKYAGVEMVHVSYNGQVLSSPP